MNYFFATYDVYLVFLVRIRNLRSGRLAFRNNLSEHGAVVPQHLGDFSGVHAIDSRNFLLFHPLVKALYSIPMAVFQ